MGGVDRQTARAQVSDDVASSSTHGAPPRPPPKPSHWPPNRARRYRQRASADGGPNPDDSLVAAKAGTSSVARPGRKQSSVGALVDKCLWANARAPAVDLIVSLAQLGSTMSKRLAFAGTCWFG